MQNHHLGTNHLPLQDRDLLQRLNLYFDSLDTRLQQGEGWVIFNANGSRSARITQYLLHRLRDTTLMSHYFVPWRDFSLTSYMVQVELQSLDAAPDQLPGNLKREYEIATRVSQQTMIKMVTADLLIVNELLPRHGHEVRYLNDTIESRYRSRLATIIVTPEQPHELEHDVTRLADHGVDTWGRLSHRLYEMNLIAI
jgi:hypothetical protein